MQMIEGKAKSYGRLLTVFGAFELLAPEPEMRNLPFYLREGAMSFYVADSADMVARHVIVKGDFAIVPYAETPEINVCFVVEDSK